MTFWKWSQTAASNSNADSTINWAEGQAPSSVNDSARATMAALAKFRDDNNGSLETAGTSTAYTISSNQVFTSLIEGITVVAKIHVTSGASPTLLIDSLTAKNITTDGTISVPDGALVIGSIYRFKYDLANDAWIVADRFGDNFNPTSAPDLNAIEALTGTGIPKRTGTNTWALTAGPADLAATTANRLIGTDGSGAVGVATITTPLAYSSSALSVGAASDSASGVIEIAVQSEMEAHSDTVRAVVPGRQHFHPGHPKAGCLLTTSGGASLYSGDYGIASITDNSNGKFTLSFDTAFSNTNYWGAHLNEDKTTTQSYVVAQRNGGTRTTTQLAFSGVNTSNNDVSGDHIGITLWGDYA